LDKLHSRGFLRTAQICSAAHIWAVRKNPHIAARCEPPESELAAAHSCQALVPADELRIRPLMAHCHLGLGMRYRMIGKRVQAHPELSASIAMYALWT
jgi:hypothetical protein